MVSGSGEVLASEVVDAEVHVEEEEESTDADTDAEADVDTPSKVSPFSHFTPFEALQAPVR